MEYKVILNIVFGSRHIPYEGVWCADEREARRCAYEYLEQYVPAGMYQIVETIKTRAL